MDQTGVKALDRGTRIPFDCVNPVKALYIHFPFCHHVCPYCDFAVLKHVPRLQARWLAGVLYELETKLHKDSLLNTVYLGGGTPSLMNSDVMAQLFAKIQTKIATHAEITMEVNPESVCEENLKQWLGFGINRISLGVQSFQEKGLSILGRNHSGPTAMHALDLLHKYFKNVSLDLIFSYNDQTLQEWQYDLATAVAHPINHLSLYGLTYEEKTLFGQQLARGKWQEEPEDLYCEKYLWADDFLQAQGFLHYEVSNFCKPGFESRHNLTYWNRQAYLGVGPGAHSQWGNVRFANAPQFAKWEHEVSLNSLNFFEELNIQQVQLEEIWLKLRRGTGISKSADPFLYEALHKVYQGFSALQDDISFKEDRFFMSAKQWLLMEATIPNWIHKFSELSI
jgi:oxygen-independent coproporphyrinogen III oxidase